jgi:hypothetical protein
MRGLTRRQTYRCSWIYAQSFTPPLAGPTVESHIAALHQALIPNWTSDAFAKFVSACRGLVDDLANSPDISNGKEEFERCQMAFRQTCWLAERFWPGVDGAADGGDDQPSAPSSASRRAAQRVQLQGAAAAATAAAIPGSAAMSGSNATSG